MGGWSDAPLAGSPDICIIDATLREGCQAPGVVFGVDESVEIAEGLAALGVDAIECGHPYGREVEAARLRAVARACPDLPVLGHARARVEDVEAVAATGATWVGIFVGINDISRRTRIRSGRPTAELVREAVGHAKQLGLKVRFTVEDASRTARPELTDTFGEAIALGADRICYADTVGCATPWDIDDVVRWSRAQFSDTPLEVHLHDDRGLAAANALAAVRAGATWVASTVNGIGERCGITDTLTLLANLGALGWRPFPDGTELMWTSRLVAAHARLAPDRWRPVVGENAFTHTAKLHRDAVAIDERSYSWVAPSVLGRTASLEAPAEQIPNERVINRGRIVEATELRHHGRGPGDRFLMLDGRVVSDARQYCIVRRIPALTDYGPGHVGAHRHSVDSLLLFLGARDDLSGLEVEVLLGSDRYAVTAPASVFVAAGVTHSYRVVGGEGLFVNHVLAGDYNSSLLERSRPSPSPSASLERPGQTRAGESDPASPPATGESARKLIESFLAERVPGSTFTPDRRLDDLLDSLAFLDFFLFLEQSSLPVSLDQLAACDTFGDVALVLTEIPNAEPSTAAGRRDSERATAPAR